MNTKKQEFCCRGHHWPKRNKNGACVECVRICRRQNWRRYVPKIADHTYFINALRNFLDLDPLYDGRLELERDSARSVRLGAAQPEQSAGIDQVIAHEPRCSRTG